MFRAALLLSLLAAASACTSTASKPAGKPVYETYVQAGQTLPLTGLTDFRGQPVRADEPGKRKLVLLFATWCHDSQRAVSHIMASDLAKDPQLRIIGIGRGENAEALARFEAEYRTNFPLVTDPDKVIYNQFANAGIPRIILVDGDNRIVKTVIGEMPRAIDEIVWP
jgi:peroxiredoxin